MARSTLTMGILALIMTFLAPSTIQAASLRGASSSLSQDDEKRVDDHKDTPMTRRRLEVATFATPLIKDIPVDQCLRYTELVGPERHGLGCGEPAATKFCHDQGYSMSMDYTLMYYAKTATYVLGMDDINPASDPKEMGKGQHTFFSSITCAEPISS